jgi:DNA-binding transcriptional regulator/RsmH inhibitor MraZ
LDSSDRLLIPKSLVQYIHNAREVIVKGELDCIQIWDAKAFAKFMESDPTDLHNMSIEISKYIDEQKAKK